MDSSRKSGLLLHITSLPSRYGIGDLGPEAYSFADFLAESHQQLWQILPLCPVGYGYSPYASPSTFAGNPLLVSPEKLLDEGLLTKKDLSDIPSFPEDRVDYEQVIPVKHALLERAFERFDEGAARHLRDSFSYFCAREARWLQDYALFMTLKRLHDDKTWTEWDAAYALRDEEAIATAHSEHGRTIRLHQFVQFLFDRQWKALRSYCNERSIQIFGDAPIYVAHDSSDVWAHQELFFLDEDGHPTVVAGVPPDYFSDTGQRWGNPLYRWDRMRRLGYQWWTQRFEKLEDWVDIVRLDHFRGFAAYWEVPASEDTALNGRWVEGPGEHLFRAVEKSIGPLPLVAENLGVITPDVDALMDQFEFPGMAVLQFAFNGNPDHDFLPHNYNSNLVVYTGTHDNDTIVGWWKNEDRNMTKKEMEKTRNRVREYLGLHDGSDEDIQWPFIRAAMSSVADMTVFPVQDLLGLDNSARMNRPAQTRDNWTWRMKQGALSRQLQRRLGQLTQIYGRAPSEKST